MKISFNLSLVSKFKLLIYNVGMKYPKDLTGMKFGAVEVLWLGRDEEGKLGWWCRCECGKELAVNRMPLLYGKRKSCGCKNKRTGWIKHGMTAEGRVTPEAVSYYSAKSRCTNANTISYKYYGGRGIKFLIPSLQAMVDEIGLRPTLDHSLDRIDTYGNYELGNIRWATPKEQRATQRNREGLRKEVGGFRVKGEPCRLIQLTLGFWMIVDAEEYERLSKRYWYAIKGRTGGFYAVCKGAEGEPSSLGAQRLIMNAKPGQRVKYRNGNQMDNRKSNLRIE